MDLEKFLVEYNSEASHHLQFQDTIIHNFLTQFSQRIFGKFITFGYSIYNSNWLVLMTDVHMSDEILRQYVDGIYQRYDINRSNTLSLNQLTLFFNELLSSKGVTQKMTEQQVQKSLRAIDTNNDGQITKMELFNALKKMNAQSNIFGISAQNNQSNLYPNLQTVLPNQKLANNKNVNYYNKPEAYEGEVNLNKKYHETTTHMTPQSYEAIPFAKPSGNNNLNNIVKPQKLPKKQKNKNQIYYSPVGSIQPPMMANMGPMNMGMGMGYPPPPMMGMGMGMGPFGMNRLSGLLGGLFGFGGFI